MKNDWAVYSKGRGFFAGHYKGPEGIVCLAGGETEAEQRDRARRLAATFNEEREAAKAAKKGAA